MGRDVGSHAHRDAPGPVHQEVGDTRRQDDRLLLVPVVVRDEVDRFLVDLAQHLHGQLRQPRLGVVADETIGDEGVVIRVHSKRVRGLFPRVFHGTDLGEVERAVDEGLHHRADFGVRDAREQRSPIAFPPLDPIDVVLRQPEPVLASERALGPDVVGQERHMVGAQSAALEWHGCQFAIELRLLPAQKPDVPGEQPGISPVGDDDLDLTARIAAEARNDSELQQELLHASRELIAAGRIGDLNRPSR